jgi:hypothetical protein
MKTLATAILALSFVTTGSISAAESPLAGYVGQPRKTQSRARLLTSMLYKWCLK